MCALFAIISLFCYRNSLEIRANGELTNTHTDIHTNEPQAFSIAYAARRRVFWFVLSLVSTLCAALCKEIGITTSLLCLAYQISFHKRKSGVSSNQLMVYHNNMRI